MALDSGDDRLWRAWSLRIILLFLAAMALLGFVVLPIIQGRAARVEVIAAICRALGIQAGSPAARQPVSETRAAPVSVVAWTPQVMERLRNPDLAKGAALAKTVCASCHGENGVSPDPQFPHMAGQSAFAIYKQLHDFKNGARANEIMAEVVKGLDDEQMADVAAYFSALTKGALDPWPASSDDSEIFRLVQYGYTTRALPGCASCHGARAGGPIETPTLAGQQREYLKAQLEAFAKGERRNDIYERMRAIAAKLRRDEIEKLSAYYAAAERVRERK